MAKWSAVQTNWTPTAVADATNFTNSGYQALQGGTSTQQLRVMEVYEGGLAGASSPAQMIVARDSTVGATSLVGGLLSALDSATANLASQPAQFSISTTKPQRSATLQLLPLAFNAFGGIVRWVAAPGEELVVLGNTASLGELSLSSQANGTPGLMASHLIFETI